MKAWTLGLLLMAAVLAEKALARPGEMDTEKDTETEDEGYQEDQEGEGGAALPPAKPPVLKTVALRLTPKPGETVVLPCNVENAPTVIWLNGTATTYVGERRFTYKDDMRTSVLKDHSLQIRDVQPSDSNSYTCKVADGLNVVHLLNVYEPPRIRSVSPTEDPLIVERNAVVTLRCNATGFPEPTITWTRQGRHLPNGKPSHVGDHIHYRDVEGKHSGIYVCTASNQLGSDERSFELAIRDGPSIDTEKDMVNTNIGENAEIACIVHAHPRAKITWQYGGHNVHPSSRIQIGEDHSSGKHEISRRHFLKIQGVKEEDLGSYACLAENEKGTARRAIKVSGLPTKAVLEHVSYDEGHPVLYWQTESMAPINKYELMYRRKDPLSDWSTVEPPVMGREGNIYKVHYELKDVEAAEYEAKLKSHNSFGWSDLSHNYPFTADPPKRAESTRVEEAGNAAPVDRISCALLLGSIAVLLLRS